MTSATPPWGCPGHCLISVPETTDGGRGERVSNCLCPHQSLRRRRVSQLHHSRARPAGCAQPATDGKGREGGTLTTPASFTSLPASHHSHLDSHLVLPYDPSLTSTSALTQLLSTPFPPSPSWVSRATTRRYNAISHPLVALDPPAQRERRPGGARHPDGHHNRARHPVDRRPLAAGNHLRRTAAGVGEDVVGDGRAHQPDAQRQEDNVVEDAQDLRDGRAVDARGRCGCTGTKRWQTPRWPWQNARAMRQNVCTLRRPRGDTPYPPSPLPLGATRLAAPPPLAACPPGHPPSVLKTRTGIKSGIRSSGDSA